MNNPHNALPTERRNICIGKLDFHTDHYYRVHHVFRLHGWSCKWRCSLRRRHHRGTIQNIGLADAQYLGTFPWDNGLEGDYILYHSDSTGFDYYFDPDTGYLDSIVRAETAAALTEEYELADDDRRAQLLAYVESCIQPSIIGQLSIEKENFNGFAYHYTIVETYSDMETGTVITAMGTPGGQIEYCLFRVGTVFQKNSDGTVTLSNPDPFIDEEDALQIARSAVAEQISGTENTIAESTEPVKIKAKEDRLYYSITIDVQEPSGYTVKYFVQVDVYTGDVLDLSFTQ